MYIGRGKDFVLTSVKLLLSTNALIAVSTASMTTTYSLLNNLSTNENQHAFCSKMVSFRCLQEL